MSDLKETSLDRFFISHPKMFNFLLKTWYPFKHKITWYMHPVDVYCDWKFRRQFKPGSFYKDHNYEPMILIELEKDGTVRGISLYDGREVMSDLYACDPRPCTELEAREQLKVVIKNKETKPLEEYKAERTAAVKNE